MRERQQAGSEKRIRWISAEDMSRRDRQRSKAPVLALAPVRWVPPVPPIIA